MAPDTIGVAIEVPVFLTYVPSSFQAYDIMPGSQNLRLYNTTVGRTFATSYIIKLPTVIIFLEIPAQLQKTVPGRSCPLPQQLPLPYPTIHLSASIS